MTNAMRHASFTPLHICCHNRTNTFIKTAATISLRGSYRSSIQIRIPAIAKLRQRLIANGTQSGCLCQARPQQLSFKRAIGMTAESVFWKRFHPFRYDICHALICKVCLETCPNAWSLLTFHRTHKKWPPFRSYNHQSTHKFSPSSQRVLHEKSPCPHHDESYANSKDTNHHHNKLWIAVGRRSEVTQAFVVPWKSSDRQVEPKFSRHGLKWNG